MRLAGCLIAVAVVLQGCDDGQAPARELALDFCATEAPVLFAVRPEGGSWSAVTPDADVTYRFVMTPRMSIAWVTQPGPGNLITTVLHVAPEDLAPLDGMPCREMVGSRTLTGSVAGTPSGTVGQIAMAAARAITFPPNQSFTLTSLPDGEVDVVAFRVSTSGNPERVIIRRNQSHASGDVLPVFDFDATGAFPPYTAPVTIDNLQPGESNRIDVMFRTPSITPFPFYSLSGFTTSPQSVRLVDPGTMDPGDLQTVDVLARAGSTSWRGDRQHFYDQPQPASLGPALEQPTIDVISPSAYPRFRVRLVRQPTYPSFIQVRFDQPAPSARRITVISTVRYQNLAGDWDIEIPDLSTVSGFPVSSPLQTNRDMAWRVEGYQGFLAIHLGALTARSRLRYAGRSGTIAIP